MEQVTECNGATAKTLDKSPFWEYIQKFAFCIIFCFKLYVNVKRAFGDSKMHMETKLYYGFYDV